LKTVKLMDVWRSGRYTDISWNDHEWHPIDHSARRLNKAENKQARDTVQRRGTNYEKPSKFNEMYAVRFGQTAPQPATVMTGQSGVVITMSSDFAPLGAASDITGRQTTTLRMKMRNRSMHHRQAATDGRSDLRGRRSSKALGLPERSLQPRNAQGFVG
jgi:hypothetical protein